MTKLFFQAKDHYVGHVTYRGGGVLKKIKVKFMQHGLIERTEQWPFKQLLLHLSYNSQAQLLLRKIQSKEDDELQLLIGSKRLRFGVVENALLNGFNFKAPTTKTDLKKHFASKRICELYFSRSDMMNCKAPGDLFMSCTMKEDGSMDCVISFRVSYSEQIHAPMFNTII